MSNKVKTFESSRKLRYGGTAVVLTVVFIAAVIVFNLMITALSSVFGWYIDLTTDQLYGLSDMSIELLKPLEDRDDVAIRMIFCADPDELDDNMYSHYVHQLAKEYEKEFSFFSVEYVDPLVNPAAVAGYKTTSGSSITVSSVIIDAGANGYRLYNMSGFYQVSQDDGSYYSFKGERAITSVILSLTGKNPIAYFTSNHGEITTSSTLASLLTDAGFEVRDIDLTKEDIDYDNAQLVIINSPLYDFGGVYDDVNEIEKIADYFDNVGSVMVFLDPDAVTKKPLPNLSELLSEWGVSFGHSIVKDYSSAISVDGLSIVAEYEADTGTTAGSLLKSITSLENLPKAIVRNAMPIEVLWENGTKEVEQSHREVSTMLFAPASAGAYDLETGEVSYNKDGYPLLSLISDTRVIDNEYSTCYMLVCGTDEFASEKYTSSASYSNSDILYAVMKAMGKVNIPTDIDVRLLDNNNLDVTLPQANAWTIVLTVVLPLVICVIGAAVYFRRKHL